MRPLEPAQAAGSDGQPLAPSKRDISNAVPPPPSLHARLKLETAEAHQRVEHAFDLAAATSRRDAYASMLAMMHNIYCGIRNELHRLSGNGAYDVARYARLQIDRLEKDLRALTVVNRDYRALSFALGHADETIGCEYVMRGSALGGKLIFKMAADNLGVTELDGGQFFHGDGRATKSQWSIYSAKLNRLPADNARFDRIICGAVKTFGHFEAALSLRNQSPSVSSGLMQDDNHATNPCA
ncbi:heme oxygenase [Novosphingobium sp. Rr 2-17]|uniref:biliverdin-producing heme oxygenase n=1 Tax=Novosphingobium sp. Rr 2-17 TaxID=555793 RepID=UPI0002698F1F|nr:biliverdin-producing heme oxygenase [Novosphingobium sp. Rr 2-17]EIZ78106.1 heme oxygenase [Novosphingobium sp. Rr 2-17]